MGCIFSSKHSTFSVLTASNRKGNFLLNAFCCTVIVKYTDFKSNFQIVLTMILFNADDNFFFFSIQTVISIDNFDRLVLITLID